MLFRVIVAGLSTCVLVGAACLSPSSNAQAQTSAASSGNCPYWIDAGTGAQVPTTTIPASLGVSSYRNYLSSDDKNHAYQSGQNFVRQPDGSWTDAGTGAQVPTTTIPASLGVSSYRNYLSGDDKNHAYQSGQNFVLIPCPPPIRTTNIRSNGAFHPFFAFEGGGGWSNTNFAVAPPFGVSGSSFVGGINGGVLIDIPGTIFSVGPRIGWQGGNTSGSISGPTASPFFDYSVKTKSIFYQEALVSIPIQRELIGFEKTFLEPGGGQTSLRFPFVTASVGIAEVQTEFTGTSGAFQVIDSANRTGFTGTVGIGMPISPVFLGGELDAYAQYRVITLPATTVSIPGQVQINNFWTQGITFGLEFRY